jgi:hypothetical protein
MEGDGAQRERPCLKRPGVLDRALEAHQKYPLEAGLSWPENKDKMEASSRPRSRKSILKPTTWRFLAPPVTRSMILFQGHPKLLPG